MIDGIAAVCDSLVAPAGGAECKLRNRAARTLADLLAMRWWRSRAVRYEVER
jgi:hypothetical protein